MILNVKIKKMAGFAKFISKEGLVNLKNYKYRGGAYTALDNAMQPFWNWFVTLIPMVILPCNPVVGGAKSDHLRCSAWYPDPCCYDSPLRRKSDYGIPAVRLSDRRLLHFLIPNA